MGEVEPAAAGHQEFARRRRHAVVDGDAGAALGQDFRGHEARRPCPDDGGGQHREKPEGDMKHAFHTALNRHSGNKVKENYAFSADFSCIYCVSS